MSEIKPEGLEEISKNQIPENESKDGYESILSDQSKDYHYLEGAEKEKKAMELVDELLDKVSEYENDLIEHGATRDDLYWFLFYIGYEQEGLAKFFMEMPIEADKKRPATHIPEKAIPYIREQIITKGLSADEIFNGFENTMGKIEESFKIATEKLEEKNNSEQIAQIRSDSKREDSSSIQKIRKFLGLK